MMTHTGSSGTFKGQESNSGNGVRHMFRLFDSSKQVESSQTYGESTQGMVRTQELKLNNQQPGGERDDRKTNN